MKKLFTEKEYAVAKSKDLLLVECYICEKPFHKRKAEIKRALGGKSTHCGKFCSTQCIHLAQCEYETVFSQVECKQCKRTFEKRNREIAKSKNNFCSRSCSATYHNTHKQTGNRRSKLEKWIEQKLGEKYQNLKIDYNEKTQINSELDIYIDQFKLAFELNGIFHYEPIYGDNKFNQTKNNDNRKFQACIEKGIELCVIDTSGLKYFKSDNAQKYLDIIEDILKIKMAQ